MTYQITVRLDDGMLLAYFANELQAWRFVAFCMVSPLVRGFAVASY